MATPEAEILHCFKTLELGPDASLDEVRKAFRKIVKVWHPDLFTGSPGLKDMAEEKLKVVNTAYTAIKSYLATRKSSVPGTGTRNNPDLKKRGNASSPSYTVTELLSDPFFWLRIRKLKWLLNEYLKSLKPEIQPQYSFQDQTQPDPTVSRDDYGKDFKQIFKEVATTRSQPHSTPHSF